MSMHSLEEEAMAAARAMPIAVKLDAESGWRAVVIEKSGAADVNGLAPVSIRVEKIRYWALDAHIPTDPGKPEHAAAIGIFGDMFSGLFGFGASPPATLWPLDKAGERLVGVHRVVPPGDATDVEIAKEAKAWLAASVEAHQKREADIARARGKAGIR